MPTKARSLARGRARFSSFSHGQPPIAHLDFRTQKLPTNLARCPSKGLAPSQSPNRYLCMGLSRWDLSMQAWWAVGSVMLTQGSSACACVGGMQRGASAVTAAADTPIIALVISSSFPDPPNGRRVIATDYRVSLWGESRRVNKAGPGTPRSESIRCLLTSAVVRRLATLVRAYAGRLRDSAVTGIRRGRFAALPLSARRSADPSGGPH